MEHLRPLGVLKCQHRWKRVPGGETKKSIFVQCEGCGQIGWRIKKSEGRRA